MICSLCYDEAQGTHAKLAEEESHMQTLSGRRSNGLSPQSRRIATFAIILFALSGLISGFAVGAFVRPKIGGAGNNNGTGISPIMQQTKTSTPSAQSHPVKLGDPVVIAVKYHEIADGTTSYTFTAYAVDQSIDNHHGKRVNVSGITGKLWLQNIPQGGFINLPESRLRHLDIQGPLTVDEVAGTLNFVTGTTQIQQSDASGQVTWNYTLATSVPPGNYFLAVLLDWSGQSFNWSWRQVSV